MVDFQINTLYDAVLKGNLDEIKEVMIRLRKKSMSHGNLFAIPRTTNELYRTYYYYDLIRAACSLTTPDVLRYLLKEQDDLHYLIDPKMTEEQEDDQRYIAFKHAILYKDFNIVEMLYDLWCKPVHWAGYSSNGEHNNNNLKRIGQTLDAAHKNCENFLRTYPNMLIGIHCLSKFNTFQNELYDALRKLSTHKNPIDLKDKAENMRDIILTVLRVYDSYSHIDSVRIIDSPEKDMVIKGYLSDKNSLYLRGQLYLLYEVYFRKLNFNVSLLVLDNLDIVKKHFGVSDYEVSKYQEIECSIYHFIYRTNENWRLYLPQNREMVTVNVEGYIHGHISDMEIKYDKHKITNGALLFLESSYFEDSLRKLSNLLQCNKVGFKVKPISASMNYLTLLPYMRDDYSLKKLLPLLKTVISEEVSDERGVLVVERTLHVIGEMTKCTPTSFHLSETTKALLQAELSVDTIKHLHWLRKYHSHIYNDQLSKRIEASKKEISKYQNVQKDLKKILQGIKTVQSIYTPIVDKSLLEKGLDVLEIRLNELPDKAKPYIERINKHSIRELESESVQYDIMQNNQGENRITDQLLREVIWILCVKKRIHNLKQTIEIYINDNSASTVLGYLKNIKQNLRSIKGNNKLWNSLKLELPKYTFSTFPNENSINLIKNKLNSSKLRHSNKNNMITKINLIKDYTDHWRYYKRMIQFCTEEIGTFEKFKNIIMANSDPDPRAIKIMRKLIKDIEQHFRWPSLAASQITTENYDFGGIRDLVNLLENQMCQDDDNEQNKRKYVIKRQKILACLINRITLLHETISYAIEIPLNQLVVRYKRDHKFRIILEMLLADIFNMFPKCGIYDFMKKSCNLLAGIDLGNVLDHGNPLLEIVGDILDPQDFSSEIVLKAMTLVKDKESIEALFDLFKDDIKPETIKNYDFDHDDTVLSDVQKKIQLFKECDLWETYLKLIIIPPYS